MGVRASLHSLPGRVFRYVSARFPESHPVRIQTERALEGYYRWVLRRNPGAPDAHSKRGSLLANRGRTAEAVESFARALECGHPDPGKIHYFMGRQQARLGNLDDATASFGRFVLLAARSEGVEEAVAAGWSELRRDPLFQPERFHGYFYLGRKALSAQLPEAAEAFLRKSVALEPLVIRAHHELGTLLHDSGRTAEAFEALREGHCFQLRQTHPRLGVSKHSGRPAQGPDFLILGKPRCGTTSLYNCLIQHPRIVPAITKELHFFNEGYDRGLEWYRAMLPPIADREGLITGEATATYLDFPVAADRILEHYPDTRFIVLLRDPVQRAVSHFYLRVRHGLEQGEVTETLLGGVDAPAGQPLNPYVECSVYERSLREWFQRFPREQFLVLAAEDLYASPVKVVDRALAFLGQAPFAIRDPGARNRGRYPPLDAAVQRRLRAFFEPHNRALEDLLEMRFDWSR